MTIYKYLRQLWKKPTAESKEIKKQRLLTIRREPTTIRIPKPTRIDRARAVGYKAKPGYVIVRQRISSGGRQRPQMKKGRRSKNNRRRKIVSKNYQAIAETRCAVKYPNLEVLNSYYVEKDGQNYWYEIILIDKNHPVIRKDKKIDWITLPTNNRRVFRGKTSAARKSRGLRNKGKGAEKARPSQRANKRRLK